MVYKDLGFYLILVSISIVFTGMISKNHNSGTDKIENQPASLLISEFDQTNDKEEIRIGLLLPNPPEKDLLALSAKQGAELAIKLANQDGGYNGHPFKLIIRTSDGLWGAGSKESVKFVYDDQVAAIVTALDGRNAHLVEQVAAKSQLVQLATRATEETLSQAYVPWFFRIVPNDIQQARALIEEIYTNRAYTKVYLMYEEDYDHQSGANTFKKILKKQGFKLHGEMVYSPSESDDGFFDLKEDTEALIVFGSFKSAKPVLEKIRKSKTDLTIFGTSSMTDDGLISSGYSDGCEGGIFISSKFCFTTPGQEFKDHFIKKYDKMPNPAASYAYDGVNLIIEAIQQSGPDREKIRDVLKDLNYDKGATGPIQFDKNGNRTSPVFLIQMLKGHPVILNP